jgi:hypothetical protein
MSFYLPVCQEKVGIYVPATIFQESLCGLPLCFETKEKVIPTFFVGKAECAGCNYIDVDMIEDLYFKIETLYDPTTCFQYLNTNTTFKIPIPNNETMSLLEKIVNMINVENLLSWKPLSPPEPNELPVVTLPKFEPEPEVRPPSAPEEVVLEPEQRSTASTGVTAEPIAISNNSNQAPTVEVLNPSQPSQPQSSQPQSQVQAGNKESREPILSSANSGWMSLGLFFPFFV